MKQLWLLKQTLFADALLVDIKQFHFTSKLKPLLRIRICYYLKIADRIFNNKSI